MLNRLKDVFKSLQKHDVKYVVIGGIASVLHGVPRATFDLDILIEALPDNAQRLLNALTDAGLQIEFLHEFEKSPYNSFPEMVKTDDGMFVLKENQRMFPLLYSIKATKK